ncbi:cysteine--tRNA ligase [Candidatus Curtissbacteria bacterium RBG_13_40_7]|uniref:Cysteine--tRNA ligase n=1 Tax=Candidatus Curtissbacteria bacterium RBG_13_40_7 TaxID=1797706 RepID=A0A1F5FUD8_9BACT|nr:MAG: cysteine--tRNA ligase [Candidatus Curtissbacteria bacterium RBG_13_40_7]
MRGKNDSGRGLIKLKLYNYLTKKIEEFKSIGQTVGLYTCGPTVYDFVHIGNWRTFIFEDILKRVLLFNGYKVKHVMNITDIDDKIIKGSREQGIGFRELAQKYEKAFFEDLEKLNIFRADLYPRATNNISSMIQIIELLLKKGFAYKGNDGVYFAVEKFKDYGKLSGLSKRNLKKGARIDSDQYNKESWSDFALWKFQKGDEASWDAPFGKGRPGWHIECSAMAQEYLGATIDIHTGGVDLLFPHHENEIAQSEAATGKQFVNFWLEGEHLLVEGEKMSKSLGNFYTLEQVSSWTKDHPLALRYLFLTAHYRSKLNFTRGSLDSSLRALITLQVSVKNWKATISNKGNIVNKFRDEFLNAINNDLDMPKAVAILWKLVKSKELNEDKLETILDFDSVLGLGFADLQKDELPERAKKLIDKREQLRSEGKFEESDKLRKELQEMGVFVEDTPSGPKWKFKK